jgi:hypothetical protein
MLCPLSNAYPKVPLTMHRYTPGMFSQNNSLEIQLDTTTRPQQQNYAAQSARKADQTGPHAVMTPGEISGVQFTPGRAWTSALPVTPASNLRSGFGPPSSQKRAPFSVGKNSMNSDMPPLQMLYGGLSAGADNTSDEMPFSFMRESQPPASTKKAGLKHVHFQ